MFLSGTKLLRSGFLVIVAIGMVGCASSKPNFLADYDKAADFGSYHTYNFMERERQGGYDGLFARYMIDALTIEMEKRGYRKSDNPDLLVNFNGIFQDKTKVTTRTSTAPAVYPAYGYYGYRRGYYSTWGAYPYGTETHVSQYTEGTFNIDLVDAKKKQLVWEAIGVGKVSDKAFKEMDVRVKTRVPEVFALYPFVAGSAVPHGRQK